LRAVQRGVDFAPAVLRGSSAEPFPPARPEDDAFLRWLLESNGLDPGQYRLDTLRRRLPSVLRTLQVATSSEARRIVQRDVSLLSRAISSAIIGVTSFFREPQVFEQLATRVLPEITAEKPPRIWSLGCSDGAELLSVAILLERLGRLEGCELLGTDCRSEALVAARRGCFNALALKDVPLDWRARYFDAQSDGWRIVERLRALPAWRFGNATAYMEPGRWDLILCRNLAIYLHNSAITILWHRLATALGPGGYLVVGKAERPSDGDRLTMVSPCVYRREGSL
jgi:chemotaxis methyl-accepting protein methylase